jgi:peptide/nickel transport system substrate-binding protein
MFKKLLVGFSVVVILGMLLAACGTPAAAPAAPAAGAKPAATEFKSKDPNTFVSVSIGEPDNLDPALDYETAGSEVNQNVYETLVWYNKESATDFVDLLAASHTISADGLVYTFKIRPGVKFHDGSALTPTDVAYSLQRAVLQSGTSSPSLLLTEPILGIGIIDAAELLDPTGTYVDDPAALQKLPAADLKAACEKVTKAIAADDAAGTVTITLAQPYAPFMATLAHTVSSILSKSWTSAQGSWDGSCDTWQKHYGTTFDVDPIAEKANGTGPYKFVSWDHATKTITLEAFADYWRKDPLWAGAQTGPAKVKTVLIKGVDEWGTRFAMAQAGDADIVLVPRSNISQVDPLVGERADFDVAANKFGELKATSTADQPLRLFFGVPALTRTDVFFVEKVNIPAEGNMFAGSGALGNGVPADFFSDAHVRKGFLYSMDWDTYIKDYFLGEAVTLPYVLSLPGELGYDPKAPKYSFDVAKAAEEFKAATLKDAAGKSVWDKGFYVIAVYNSGNAARKAWLDILSAGLKKVNPIFRMEVLAVPWAATLHYRTAMMMPVYNIGWQEDIHDPHNWYSPYLVGDYGSKAGFSKETMAMWKDYVNRGVAETDPAKRDAIYKELNQKVYDYAPYMLGVLAVGRHYEQRWVTGYYNNPLYGGFYYYELGKK